MQRVKILLVDDHALLREALRTRLEKEFLFSIVGIAGSADEAIDLARKLHPDVILMDIDMPGLICFDAVRTILAAQPDTRVIFLSAHTHDRYIDEALRVGALGYITKNEPPERLTKAIREVMEGRADFSDSVRSRIVFDADRPRLAPSRATRASRLTPRETEVMRYVARGLSKKEIASLMHVSLKTVEKHTENLMTKLDIHDRVEIARFAIREGFANP